MVKPNITGMSLKTYLELRHGQLSTRKMSIKIYNKNYLPSWGEKYYTEDDLKQIEADLEECRFLMTALESYKTSHKPAAG